MVLSVQSETRPNLARCEKETSLLNSMSFHLLTLKTEFEKEAEAETLK